MTRAILTFIIPLLFAMAACHSSTQTENKVDSKIDTTKAIRIDDYWVVPKEKLDFVARVEETGDTLTLLVCGDYPYFPFGQLADKSQIENSLLKNFEVTPRIDTIDDIPFEFQILKHKSSRLILFINDDQFGEKSSYIMKGDVSDNDVNFTNGIKIGITKDNFIKAFFDSFPRELILKYNIIAFETCIEDLRHTYVFDHNKLKYVNFKSHSYWKVNY